LETPWSLVKEKANNDQKQSVSRRQASEDRKRARNIKAIPTASVSPSTPSQSQEILRDNDNTHQDPGAQEPTHGETAAPLRDNDFFYKNGNPKPPSTGRLLIRLIKRKRKRPRGRKQERRRDKRHGSTVVDPKEITLEIPETTNEAAEPSQFPNPARDKMLLFSFMKYAIRIQNRDNHIGPTHSPDLPIQHKVRLLGKHPLKPVSEIGAACFRPHTALLLQDPLNHDTYDPGKALSRPIGEIGYGNIVLAEKQGMDGRSKFFLAKVTCVMLFEIPQDGDLDANKILQEKTLSKGLGLTLTKHHHIRKHGSIHEQEPGRWRFTNLASDSE